MEVKVKGSAQNIYEEATKIRYFRVIMLAFN